MPSLFLYMYYIHFPPITRGLEGRWCPRKNGCLYLCLYGSFFPVKPPMPPRIHQQSFRWKIALIWYSILFQFTQRWRIGAWTAVSDGRFSSTLSLAFPVTQCHTGWHLWHLRGYCGESRHFHVKPNFVWDWSWWFSQRSGWRDLQMCKAELLARSFRHVIALYALVFSNISPLHSIYT